MGNVKSFCCKDSISECDDREERSRILNDTFDESAEELANGSIASGQSLQDSRQYGSISDGTKSSEQTALDKIYHRMAANVIDVAPGESIQQAEFIERQKAYQTRLSLVKTPLPLKANRLPNKLVNSSFDATFNNHSPSSNAANSTLAPMNTTLGSNFAGNFLSPVSHNVSTISNSPQFVTNGQEKRRLEYEPISADDIQLIDTVSSKSAKAMGSIKIVTSEQVIAQFKP